MQRDEIMRRVNDNKERAARGERVPVLPPLNHIERAGHHWLQVRDGFGGVFETCVLQWAPNDFCWYHSGCVATNAPSIPTTGWKYIAPCPMPPLEEIVNADTA